MMQDHSYVDKSVFKIPAVRKDAFTAGVIPKVDLAAFKTGPENLKDSHIQKDKEIIVSDFPVPEFQEDFIILETQEEILEVNSTIDILGQDAFKKNFDHLAPSPKETFIEPLIIKGRRQNSTLYGDGNGFYYLENSSSKFRKQLRCNLYRQGCHGTASLITSREKLLMIPRATHNHAPNMSLSNENAFIDTLRRRAIDERNSSVQEIYRQEAKKNPLAASKIPYLTAKQRMQRARRTSDLANLQLKKVELQLETENSELKGEEIQMCEDYYNIQDGKEPSIEMIEGDGEELVLFDV